MSSYRLATDSDMIVILEALDETPVDGSHIVTIDERKIKRSSRQLNLWWLIMRALAASGVGHTESPEGFDSWCKWKFTLPEMCADDDWMASHWEEYRMNNSSDSDALIFAQRIVHNGDLSTKQMASVLTQVYRFFGEYDIALPDPNEYRDELRH